MIIEIILLLIFTLMIIGSFYMLIRSYLVYKMLMDIIEIIHNYNNKLIKKRIYNTLDYHKYNGSFVDILYSFKSIRKYKRKLIEKIVSKYNKTLIENE